MKAMPFLLKTLKLQAIIVKKILRKELLVSMFVSNTRIKLRPIMLNTFFMAKHPQQGIVFAITV